MAEADLREHSMPVTPPIPAQKPPKRPLIPHAIRPWLVVVFFGICLKIAFGIWAASGEHSARIVPGEKYLAAGAKWQSFDVVWTDLDGMVALDMSIVGDRYRGPKAGAIVDNELLLSLCGSVLTAMPLRDEMPVHRNDIYRLGFRFVVQDAEGLGETLPLVVVDGICGISKGQSYFEWNYPGVLSGWRPSNFGLKTEGGTSTLLVHFQRRSGDAVAVEDFDFVAACAALLADTPYRIRPLLKQAQRIYIQASRGMATPLLTLGATYEWQFSVVNGVCILDGKAAKA